MKLSKHTLDRIEYAVSNAVWEQADEEGIPEEDGNRIADNIMGEIELTVKDVDFT